jgi:hypothetical protein
MVRVLSGIPEIDELEDRLAQPLPARVTSIDRVPAGATGIEISRRTRGLEHLARYSSVRRVVARSVGDEELEQIARIAPLENLELVDLKSGNLSALQPLSHLRILSISNSARLLSLDGIEGMGKLQLLSASNAQRLASIEAVASLRDLRVLFLAGGMYRSMRIPSLRPIARLNQLVKLVLMNVGVADRSLSPLSGLKNLRRLTLPRYFPAEEFAMLERELPEAEGDWRAAFKS